MEDEQSTLELLQRYRRDRRMLLNYMLSGNLIKKVVLPPGSVSLHDVDLDVVSIDYVLNCAKKGEMLDLSEAIRVFYDSLEFPSVGNNGSVEEFFLVTRPESSGLPPSRAPPPIPVPTPAPIMQSMSNSKYVQYSDHQELSVDDIDDFEEEEDEGEEEIISRHHSNNSNKMLLGLPSFETGISDDDLRETAYEIIVACVGASGGLIVPSKEKKKEKKSKLIRKLARSKNENVASQPRHASGLVGLLETMRVQLEISEAMDIRTRQGLLNALIGRGGKGMDALLVPLELLSCVSRSEFSDKKAYLRWQKRQLNMLEEGLINYPVVGFGESGRKASDVRILLRKIEESESLPSSAGEVQRTECLRSLREISTALAERPARGDLAGDICHWADGYHLNVRLYEKMLVSVFDILDEGKLTEEFEEILELLKSTWRVLGITETIHDTCHAWVLFCQFIATGEDGILKLVIEQLRKIPLKEQRGPQERLHLKSLRCLVDVEGGPKELTFLQSFLSPIKRWADNKLGDYHLNFSEEPGMMADILTAALIVQKLLLEETDQFAADINWDQIEAYITSSIRSSFSRILHSVEARADSVHEHMLASLAKESKRLLKTDGTVFMPIFTKQHSHAPVVSASLLHKLYGNKLRPFLDHAEHLTEDVVSVFPAADSLERYIMTVIDSASEEEIIKDNFRRKLNQFKIEDISGTLVLRWVNGRLGRVVEWVERSIQQESWDPISPQQRHGSSIVEVYRIVEETVDQFFALKVPMRPGELNSLFRGLDNAFQIYTNKIDEKIVDKEELIPPAPALTRYSKESLMKVFVKKDIPDYGLTNERKSSQINVLSMPKLCVRLNTLHYAVNQLNKLEDSIQEQWTRKKHSESFNTKLLINERSHLTSFDGSRKDINTAMNRMCDFMGTKIIFWDMREPFINNLYKNSVSQFRLETVVEELDVVLNLLCDIIVEPLRDRLVTGLLQASLDGLLRVILDGGSSRVFCPSDATVLEEDLEILKEFFISGGDGLPRGTVENLIARIRPVIALLSHETRVLIDDMKFASQGNRSRFGADFETLLRILCHRNDSEASQFLKKQYKLPKSSA